MLCKLVLIIVFLIAVTEQAKLATTDTSQELLDRIALSKDMYLVKGTTPEPDCTAMYKLAKEVWNDYRDLFAQTADYQYESFSFIWQSAARPWQ